MLNILFCRIVRENLVFTLYIFKCTIIFTMASIICSACSAVFNNSKAYTMHLSMSIHCGMSVVLSTAASSTVSKKTGGDKLLSQLDTAEEVTTKKDPKESFVDGNNMIAVSTAETHDVLLDNTIDDNVQTYPQPDNVMDNEDAPTREHITRSNEESIIMTDDDVTHIELLTLCQKIRAPLYAYNSIMEWANRARQRNSLFSSAPRSRDWVMNQLYTRYDLHGIKPKQTNVELLDDKSVPVVHFDFKAMMKSLLNDTSIMKEENLLLEANPCVLPPLADHLGDINTSGRYRQMHRNLCNGQSDILCPLILFIDKSHLDQQMGKYTLEPVMATIGILKRHIRSKPSSWVPLGFVPSLSHSIAGTQKKAKAPLKGVSTI